jgi:uncharacterized protein
MRSIEMDGFDAMAKEIMSLGGQVSLRRFVVAGKCWQGYFIEPEGSAFRLFEVDENAK